MSPRPPYRLPKSHSTCVLPSSPRFSAHSVYPDLIGVPPCPDFLRRVRYPLPISDMRQSARIRGFPSCDYPMRIVILSEPSESKDLSSNLQHLTTVFSTVSALFCATEPSQLLPHQSFPHSFPCNGGGGCSLTRIHKNLSNLLPWYPASAVSACGDSLASSGTVNCKLVNCKLLCPFCLPLSRLLSCKYKLPIL